MRKAKKKGKKKLKQFYINNDLYCSNNKKIKS